MFKEVIHKDLLEYPANAIVHQANCFCTMGSGVAAQIRKKYPEAYEADCATEKGGESKLGTYSWALAEDGKYIFNLYSQFDFGYDGGRRTSYDALVNGFEKIKDNAEKQVKVLGKAFVVAIPYKIGSDLGGGNWQIVRAIIKEIFLDSEVELVVVCRPQDITEEDKKRVWDKEDEAGYYNINLK